MKRLVMFTVKILVVTQLLYNWEISIRVAVTPYVNVFIENVPGTI